MDIHSQRWNWVDEKKYRYTLLSSEYDNLLEQKDSLPTMHNAYEGRVV